MTPTSPAGSPPGEDALREALAYFRPHPTANGPVILTPSKMRAHLAVIEALLASTHAAARAAEKQTRRADAVERENAALNEEANDDLEHRLQRECAIAEVSAERDALARMVGEMSAELAKVMIERDEARATNRELHRRMQVAEGPLLSRLLHRRRGAEFWWRQRKLWARRAEEAALAATADLQARIAGLEAENARLRAGLEPFGLAAGFYEIESQTDENAHILVKREDGFASALRVKDFRRARALMKDTPDA